MATRIDFAGRQRIMDCVQKCMSTQRACLDTVRYCLDKGGRFSMALRIRVLLDAASMCQTCADDSRLGSILYIQSCAYCADLLERCIREFDPLRGDPKVEACLKQCADCASCCRTMSAAAAA